MKYIFFIGNDRLVAAMEENKFLSLSISLFFFFFFIQMIPSNNSECKVAYEMDHKIWLYYIEMPYLRRRF